MKGRMMHEEAFMKGMDEATGRHQKSGVGCMRVRDNEEIMKGRDA